MTKEEQIEKIEHFVQKVMLEELGNIQQTETCFMPFVLYGQAIEVLGSFFDNKPMKTPGQASKRFSAGVKFLFGGRYRLLNENNYLYDKLRNQMTHAFIPGGDLWLMRVSDGEHIHLQKATDGRLVLISDVFYQDICKAGLRLIQLLKEGRLKPKNIAFDA